MLLSFVVTRKSSASMIPVVLLYYLLLSPSVSFADIQWPLYNQQCLDDAGSPFPDDAETYGTNGFYHDKSAAYPVLQDGKCPAPLEQACEDRPTYKAAFLEGPIDCGDNGWYCRIIPDDNWPPINLIADLNFGHCNTTQAFEDAGYDKDGHCHGSSVDSTYYWWVRDHFFRQYNGRLRCCCGWYEDTSLEPLYGRRIANRCDYRRLVTQTENLAECRDANEGHGLGFDDIGCDPAFKDSQLNKPIPEDDSICWEVQRFGYTVDEYDTPTINPAAAPTPTAPTPTGPTPTGPTPTAPTPTGPTPTAPTIEPDCEDSLLRFRIYIGNRRRWKKCTWAAKSPSFRCSLDEHVKTMCPATCETCDDCVDSDARFKIEINGRMRARNCDWVASKKTASRCEIEGVAEACRYTCGLCDYYRR